MKKVFLIIICVAVCLSACNNESNTIEQKKNDVSQIDVITDDNNCIENGNFEHVSNNHDEISIRKKIEWDDFIENGKKKSSIKNTIILCETNSIKNINSSLSLKSERGAFLFYDNENDELYYSNIGVDDSLSMYNNGKSQVLIPVTANYINVLDGYIYYICDSAMPLGLSRNGLPFYDLPYGGDIYRYCIETGENELIVDTNALRLSVNQNGIDYIAGQKYYKSPENPICSYDRYMYHCDIINDMISEPKFIRSCFKFSPLGLYYNEYMITEHEGALSLYCAKNNHYDDFYAITASIDQCAVYNNSMFFINDSTELIKYDFLSGITYSIYKSDYITSYTCIDDIVFVSDGLNLIKCKGESVEKYRLEKSKNEGYNEIVALYSDNENVYVMTDRKGLYIIEFTEYYTFKMSRLGSQ